MNINRTMDFSVLLSRKKALLASGLVAACLAFGFSKILPFSYAGESGIIVETPQTETAAAAADTGSSVVQTQIDVLQSKGLIKKVVEDQKITDTQLFPKFRLPDPVIMTISDTFTYLKDWWHSFNDAGPPVVNPHEAQDARIEYVQKHLQIAAKVGSKLITIRFIAGTPDVAASVVNGIVENYLATDTLLQTDKVAHVNDYIAQQSQLMQAEITTAQDRLAAFVRSTNVPEVQGATSAALQLSKDQEALSIARQQLALRKAAFDTLQNSGVDAAEETLESQTIQTLKNYEAQMIQQLGTLSNIDPRRQPIVQGLNSVRAQITHETALIKSSIERNVAIAQAKVVALEIAVREESGQSQDMSNATVTLKHLQADVETKRQAFLAFLSQAGMLRGGAEQTLSAHILFTAVPPPKPVNTFATLSLVLGFISGTMVAAGTILMRETFGSKISSTYQLERATGLPSFHALPDLKLAKRNGGVIATNKKTDSQVVETLRSMSDAMPSARVGDGTAALVTSSEVGEGKTITAMAVAQQFADDGLRVLLIDADIRRPRLARVLNATTHTCLENVVDETSTLTEAVYREPKFGYDCLLSNGKSRNPSRVLKSAPFKRLLEEAKKNYDFVIMDSPPVLHVVDPVLLSDMCDYILFVVASDRVSGDLVAEATRRFSERGRERMLTLLTRVKAGRMDKRDYYSGYESDVSFEQIGHDK